MTLHLSRMRRNVNRNVYNDRKNISAATAWLNAKTPVFGRERALSHQRFCDTYRPPGTICQPAVRSLLFSSASDGVVAGDRIIDRLPTVADKCNPERNRVVFAKTKQETFPVWQAYIVAIENAAIIDYIATGVKWYVEKKNNSTY